LLKLAVLPAGFVAPCLGSAVSIILININPNYTFDFSYNI